MTDRVSTPSPANPHFAPADLGDRVALGFVKLLRFVADTFFAKRYGHRAVVLETVAAVPGMVAGLLQHLRSLRRMEDDDGWIRELLDEADNERMHLLTFVKIAQPSLLERMLILFTQFVFYNAYFFLYLASPKTAHRVVGYFEEEAVISYTRYLAEIDAGRQRTWAFARRWRPESTWTATLTASAHFDGCVGPDVHARRPSN